MKIGGKKYPDLPSKIRIGYKEYKISVVDRSPLETDFNLGTACHFNPELAIGPHENAVELADTVFHEILHACWKTQGVEDGDSQERTVTMLANGVTGVFRYNPRLLDWFKAVLK